MSKVILLDGKYTLGRGIGSWARSHERGVKCGDVRFIGGVLMYAYKVYKTMWFVPEIHWTPTDSNLCHDFEKLIAWASK
jgi:hypothetical protein